MSKSLTLIKPRGFCAGVERAINILEKALKQYPHRPIAVNHEIVHNKTIVQYFCSKGVIFSDDIESLPPKTLYIFSAHGVSPSFRKKVARRKDLVVIDATCPLVEKVHWEAEKFFREGYTIFYIGQKHHQESQGVLDICPMHLIESLEDIAAIKEIPQKAVVLSQTTLSVERVQTLTKKLKEKIPHLREPKDLCYATQNRQSAVKALAGKVDFMLVIGSKNSSNSNKLVEVAKKAGIPAALFDNAKEIPLHILDSHQHFGLTSGASVPEHLIQEVCQRLKALYPDITIKEITEKTENLSFPLPVFPEV